MDTGKPQVPSKELVIYTPVLNGTAFMGMAKRGQDGIFGPEFSAAVAFWTPHKEAFEQIAELKSQLHAARADLEQAKMMARMAQGPTNEPEVEAAQISNADLAILNFQLSSKVTLLELELQTLRAAQPPGELQTPMLTVFWREVIKVADKVGLKEGHGLDVSISFDLINSARHALTKRSDAG